MKQYQSKHTAALSTRGFYTILSLCALIIAASAWVIWGNAHRQNAVEPDTGMRTRVCAAGVRSRADAVFG